MSQEIGFFYGSTTGMTEDVAYRIEACIKEKFGLEIVPINIIDLDDPNDMFLYKRIILGMRPGTTANTRTTGSLSSIKSPALTSKAR